MAALSPPAPLDVPVTAVTVYSDRARVTRSAQHALPDKAQPLPLPLLPPSVDPASIRFTAEGAEVQRVEISFTSTSPLPQAEAQALLDQIDQLADDIAALRGERAVHVGVLGTVRGLTPTLPDSDTARPFPRLSAAAWDAALGFQRRRSEQASATIRRADEQLRQLQKRHDQLTAQARLLGAGQAQRGYRVVPTVRGTGALSRLTLSYVVQSARWLPSYDIQLHPAQGTVDLAFAGLVSQESGEDWSSAALTLSTAVPATTTQLPRLVTWKLGERERFVPTPRPAQVVLLPPPQAPPPAAREDDARGLRGRLSRLTVDDDRDASTGKDGKKQLMDRDEPASETVEKPRPPEPVVAPPPPPPPPPARPEPVERAAELRVMLKEESVSRAPGRGYPAASVQTVAVATTPVMGEALGLLPPPGYVPPPLDPQWPAAQAGGHDLSYPSLARETVASGKGQRRVALFQRSFPVTVHHRVLPALSQEAYLVAEIRNPLPQPLPGGVAQLQVGADPAGSARLKVSAPGEVFTLPLGLDHEVKPIRNVSVTTAEKGVFSKDEISEYTVTEEIANPYRRPLSLRVVDQVPLTQDRSIELRLVRTEPPAAADPVTGALEWRVTVPAGGKQVCRFVYTLRRPRGYQLQQEGGR